MDQAPKSETMTQRETDALMQDVETGNLGGTSLLDSLKQEELLGRNYKQLKGAMRRLEIELLANVGPEERPARLAQVHYYAHQNWLVRHGFASKKDFRAFMNGEAGKRGITLNWGGK